MRISDWSSDVCSSDLQAVEENGEGQAKPAEVGYFSRQSGEAAKIRPAAAHWRRCHFHGNPWENVYACPIRARFSTFPTAPASPPRPLATRSDEHPSELQSLMRTSYATFCLQTKTK